MARELPEERPCHLCGVPMVHTEAMGWHCTLEHPKGPGDKVVRLVPRKSMPNEDLVAMLERMTASAKVGELVAVSVACIWNDESTSWGNSAGANFTKMIGAIARLQHHFIASED